MNKLPKRSHFWSHIFFSMLALLALPHVQGVERTDALQLEYQNQPLQTQSARSVFVQQEQLQQAQTPRPTDQSAKQPEFRPHLVRTVLAEHAPIRGSPRFS